MKKLFQKTNFEKMANYGKVDIHHGLRKDHTQHEAKKMCDKRSRSFQACWKKNILGCDSYCGTCLDSNSSAERLANLNSAFVSGTENFCLDSIKSHESSKILVQAANTCNVLKHFSFFFDQLLVLMGK